MKVLVRLPNWLGDMVMATGFLHQLPRVFPGAEIGVIAKKGIHELLPFLPPAAHHYLFSKDEARGMNGLLRFGRSIRQHRHYDLFFCLPDSLSTAIVGAATGAARRIGYRKEGRGLLLTDACKRPPGLHRAEEYVYLLNRFTGHTADPPLVQLHHSFSPKDHVVVNINSEAQSRRLTTNKAIALLSELRGAIGQPIVLIGAPKEKELVDGVLHALPDRSGITNLAGATTLPQLVEVLASARLLLTTDSGPAHLANALGTDTVVLFGAGDEAHTAPYAVKGRSIVRLGGLACEPCRKNTCARFQHPQCLERLDNREMIRIVRQHLHA